MSRPLRFPPTPAKHPELTAEEFVTEVYKRLESDDRRAVDYYRRRELSPPFSRTWIDARLADGSLQAVRLRGLTLIRGPSLRKLLQSASPWKLK